MYVLDLSLKVTQMESDLENKITTAFQIYTAEVMRLEKRVIQLEYSKRNDFTTFRNYDMRTTALETKSKNYSETIKDQSIRISALEGNLAE